MYWHLHSTAKMYTFMTKICIVCETKLLMSMTCIIIFMHALQASILLYIMLTLH